MIRFLIFTTLVVSPFITVKAQAEILDSTHFPDNNFLAALQSIYPGGLSEDDAAMVFALNVESSNISDVTGIEYFIGISYLVIRYNQIQELPSLSLFPNLLGLHCQSNQLTNLDGIDQLTNLTALNCSENPIPFIPNIAHNPLGQLNTSSCPIRELTWLGDIPELFDVRIANMKLNSIPDLSGLINLGYLDIRSNRISGPLIMPLTTELHTFFLADNLFFDLPDLAVYTGLERLYIYDNLLSEFPDLSMMPLLDQVSANNNLFTTADCPRISAVESLGISFSYGTQGTFKEQYQEFPSWPNSNLLLDWVDMISNQSWNYALDCSQP